MKLSRFATAALMSLVLVGVGVTRVHAQTPISFVAGPTFASQHGDDVAEGENDSRTGFFFAVGTSFPLGETGLMIEPYLGYMQKGAADPNSFDEVAFDYLEVPVLLTYGFPVGESAGISVSAGPAFGYNIKCDFIGVDCGDDDDFNKFELGILGGAGIGFPLGEGKTISVGGGFDFGLTKIFQDIAEKNKTFFLYFGLNMMVGG